MSNQDIFFSNFRGSTSLYDIYLYTYFQLSIPESLPAAGDAARGRRRRRRRRDAIEDLPETDSPGADQLPKAERLNVRGQPLIIWGGR